MIHQEAQYDAAKESFFNEKVNENFSNTVNTANESASANNNADGTIAGVFDSSSYSRSQIGATASAINSYTEQATREAMQPMVLSTLVPSRNL